MGGPLEPKRLDSKQPFCMRSFTAHGATWKTASRNSKWISLPIVPAPTGLLLISCGCGSRPILSKRFSAWFTSDSVPWAAPLNIRTQPTELKSCLARAGQSARALSLKSEEIGSVAEKIAVIRKKALEAKKSRYVEDRE